MKPFYRSKTLIVSTILLILLFVDFFAPGFLPLPEIEKNLDNVFVSGNDGLVTKFNWGALFSIVSMIVLRFMTKDKVQILKNKEQKVNWTDKNSKELPKTKI